MILLLCIAVFGIAAVKLIDIGKEYYDGQKEYEELKAYIKEVPVCQPEKMTGDEPEKETGKEIDFEGLRKINEDLVAWIQIPGIGVDYPVVQGEDNEYYLYHTFQKENNKAGSIFLDYRNHDDFTDRRVILYGHNMKDGSMFAALLNYADDTFWEEHPTIRFDTLEETGTYQVLAAFYIDVSLSEDGVAFPFYEYTGLRDEAIFQEYLAQVGDRALYSTGVTAEFGEQLLTLSTCSYNTSDERFVVVAKQVV